ncbi:39S ribosomal protein L51, mitochondrial [Phlyctochytrium planicorne]|nr:39S ribosomal protein L51, mitochondrial [Phlyctochytrium planicorne]
MEQLIQRLRASGLGKKMLPDKNLTPRFQNGVGCFIPQIQKVVVHYDHPREGAGGDSAGMVDFIHRHLIPLAEKRPYVEICVQPRKQSPPELIAHYLDGTFRRHICYKLPAKDILRQFNYLCDTAPVGEKRPDGNPPFNTDTEVQVWVRRRKNPRGSGKEGQIDLKSTQASDWKKKYWRAVHGKDWKTIGRPTDRDFTTPVLSGGKKPQLWDPFHSSTLFRP